MLATTANALVYPYTLHQANLWRVASAAMFVAGLSVSLWLVARATRLGGAQAERGRRRGRGLRPRPRESARRSRRWT